VVGGSKVAGGPGSVPVSVLLLDRGNHLYRSELLRELEHIGFESIVSVESAGEVRDIESLAQRFPKCRFLLLGENVSPGEMINVGMRESQAPYVFVLWGDMRLSNAALSGRFFERLGEQDLLCRAPFFSSRKGEVLPTMSVPGLQGSSLKVLGFIPPRDAVRTLFPFDYVGIYSKARFVLTGGFDGGIPSPYWQKLDFGFRSWLWGEEIRLSQALRVAYEDEPKTEDATPGEEYKWFWLKNLAPVYRGDSATVPPKRFWSYLRKRIRSPLAALREFREATAWVELNRFRFRSDAASLVDLWEDETP